MAAARFLREHGFWEYTTPLTGGFETYGNDDHLLLLDDMAQAGMNSIMLMVKWYTTGYRSRLPYLDQSPENRVIASDNKLLRKVIAEAKSRRIKVWLGAVANYFNFKMFGSIPYRVIPDNYYGFQVGMYDPDAPQVVERGAAIFEELCDEFPGVDGLMVELENVDGRAAHRIPFYNEWAKSNKRPPYGDLNTVSDLHWFDYQTASIIKATKAIEKAVRAKGFRGDLATINKNSEKIGGNPQTRHQMVNLEMMRRDCPAWATINYWYYKGLPDGKYDLYPAREYMETGVAYPKSLGMNVYYLPRGVMTYLASDPPNEWTDRDRLDVADVQEYQPQNLWWFGAGSKGPGVHTSLPILKQMGYADDVAARRALLGIAAPLRAAML
jgi:hypothetical protein